MSPEIVMSLESGPEYAPRVPCARCGSIVCVEIIIRPGQVNVCVACCSAELADAIRRGVRLPVIAAKPRTIEAWRAFESELTGLAS